LKAGLKILTYLKLQEGDSKLLVLPLLYSFFSGASLAFFVTSATSLFLNNFSRDKLSLAFILAGFLMLIIGKVYTFFQKKYSFVKVLNAGPGFFLLSIIVLLVIFIKTHSLGVIFLLYAWIRVFSYIHQVTFWMFLGKLFSIQQGKKVFGFISTGEVLAGILSFFSVPFLLKIISTEDILLISVVSLFVAFIVLIISTRIFKDKLCDSVQKASKKINLNQNKNKELGFKKYYKLFFVIAFVPIFAQLFVDYMFQALAQVEFPEKETLTSFVGIFFGVSSVIEFIFKVFISGSLLSKYGIRFGLYSFPVVLAISFVGASFSGFALTDTMIFFSFVALGRLFTRAVRTSFYDPSVQILYQPLPSEERMIFQNKIESGPKAYAGIATGVILLIFQYLPQFTLVYFSLFILVITIFWIKITADIYTEYKIVLRNNLENIEGEISEKINLEFLAHLISGTYSVVDEKARKILSTFTKFIIPFYHKIIFKTCENDDDKVKFNDLVENSLSTDTQKRLQAAKLLGNYKIYKSERHLIRLLNDSDYEVRTSAIITAGEMKETELYDNILMNLRILKYRNIAAQAALNIGDDILPELEHLFYKTEFDIDLQIKILDIYRESKSKSTIKFLRKILNNHNYEIAYQVINILGEKAYIIGNKEISFVNKMLQTEIGDLVYIISSIEDLYVKYQNSEISLLLNNEKIKKTERIINILRTLYDNKAVQLIKNNIMNHDKTSGAYALEIADNLFSEFHKKLLFPIFENDSNEEILRKYSESYIIEKLSPLKRLFDIINSDVKKTGISIKIEAVKLLSEFTFEEVGNILKANIVQTDIMISESSAVSLYNISKVSFFQVFEHYSKISVGVSNLMKKLTSEEINGSMLVSEKHNILQSLEFFGIADYHDLKDIAQNSEEIFIQENDIVNFKTKKYSTYIFIDGKIIEKQSQSELKQGSVVTFINDNYLTGYEYIAEEDSFFLRTDFFYFQNFIIKNPGFFEKYFKNIYYA
jgi:ATP/ADP translocase